MTKLLIKYNKNATIFNALVGFVGLKPSIVSLKLNRTLLLANKESLVCGGNLINKILKRKGKIYPIDSEHVAIAKCLYNENISDVADCFTQLTDYLEQDVAPAFSTFNHIAEENKQMATDLKSVIVQMQETLQEFGMFLNNVTRQMSSIQQASEQNERGVGDIVNKTSSATLVSEQMINVANSNKESVEKLMKIIDQFTEEKQV